MDEMDEDQESLKLRHVSDEQKRRAVELRRQCLQTLAANFRTELTEFQMQMFIAALMTVSEESLRKALVAGVRRWHYFPHLAEFFEAVDEVEADPAAHSKAYGALLKRYEQAYLPGTVRPTLKSVVTDAIGLPGEVPKLTSVDLKDASPQEKQLWSRKMAEKNGWL
jgi:hypothetical protein